MSLIINTNVGSLNAQRSLAASGAELKTAMERLSSGSKINSASDDAAGFAIAERMTAQIRGLNMAAKNAGDGLSMLSAIENATNDVTDMLQRMRELAVQAVNDTNTAQDRVYLQQEVTGLIAEIDRVANQTQYNGQAILDGSMSGKIQVGTEADQTVEFSINSISSQNLGSSTSQQASTQNIPLDSIWSQIGSDIDAERPGDVAGVGLTMSKDGQVVAVGAQYNDDNGGDAGQVRIFEWDGSNWMQRGSDIDGLASQDRTGGPGTLALSADGNRAAVRVSRSLNEFEGGGSDVGQVRVFDWDGANWNQVGGDIFGEAASDWGGHGLSFSDDGVTLAISAPYNDGGANNAGHVRILGWDGVNWTQKGSDIDGENPDDRGGMGTSATLSGDGNTIVIGAYSNRDGGSDGPWGPAGHARVYRWDGDNWNQMGLDIDGQAGDWSGENTSISRDGNIVAIGARFSDGNGQDSGTVRVFGWDGSAWNQVGQDIDGEVAGDQFGSDLALSDDGNLLVAGAFLNDGNGNDSGSARVFGWDGGAWNQIGQDIDGEAVDDKSGNRVSISSDGSVVAISAADNDGIGYRAGHVRIFENDSVAAWRESSSQSGGLSALDLTEDASAALETITSAIEQVAGDRAEYGALQNRLEYTVSNLMNVSEFTTAARSRIADADFAAESARLAKAQVLQQSGAAMLAQANASSLLALSLIR